MHRELLLVSVGLLALTLHSLDEMRIFGAPSGPPWAAQIAIVTLLIALTAVHRRLGPWRLLVAAVLALFGAVVVSTGWSAHVWPLLQRGPGPADATGVLFVVGGLLLLASGGLLVQHASGVMALSGPGRRLGQRRS